MDWSAEGSGLITVREWNAMRSKVYGFTSPCAALVPSTSGMPLPMMVLAMMMVGLPLSSPLALAMALSMAPKS